MGNNLEIKTLKVKDIHPYKRNPRKNDQAVDAVAESIRQCGYCAPIVVDENHEVLAGHTRLKAIKKLGWTECEVVIKEGLTDEQKRKYRLLDNKTNELAEWDMELLEIELDGLDFEGFEFGFSQDEPLQIAEEKKGSLADKYLVPPFSVIYGNKPDWLARKRRWVDFGIRSELGRGGDLLTIQGAILRQTSYLTRGGGSDPKPSRTTPD